MPPKDDDNSSTKEVVTKKQKQMLNREELDLSVIAEAFGGFVLEPTDLMEKLKLNASDVRTILQMFKSAPAKLKLGQTAPGAIVKYVPPAKGVKKLTPLEKAELERLQSSSIKDRKVDVKTGQLAKVDVETGQIVVADPKVKTQDKTKTKTLTLPLTRTQTQTQPVRTPIGGTRVKPKGKPTPTRKPFRPFMFKPPRGGTLYLGRRQNPQ